MRFITARFLKVDDTDGVGLTVSNGTLRVLAMKFLKMDLMTALALIVALGLIATMTTHAMG